VQSLEAVAVSAGSREMTREEISVLSSSRRDAVRRQMEEADRAKANPLLHVFNPRLQVSHVSSYSVLLVY
jgi:junctophilin